MSEAAHGDLPQFPTDQTPTIGQEIEFLRRAGAERFDPVGLLYLQALAGRASVHQGQVKHLLDARLAQVLQNLKARLAQARQETREDDELVAAAEPNRPLAALVAQVAQHAQQHADVVWMPGLSGSGGARPELKSVRYFRDTWSRLSVNKQLTKALDQAPKNAGPINSHMLVLRSLALMRDISPDYLNRFMSYVDTLLCLDQADQARQSTVRKINDGQQVKKTTGRRARRG